MSFLRSTILHSSLGVHHADVAGAEEPVCGHRPRGFLGSLPIAGHDLRPTRADLALFAERHLAAVVIPD